MQLDWWPLTRDSVIVIISTSSLVGCLWDERVYWYEAVVFVVLYVLYFLVMFQNNRMKKIAVELIENRWDLCRRIQPKPENDYTESYKSTNKYSIAVIAETKNSILESPNDKEVVSVPEDSTVESNQNTSSGMKLCRISTESWFAVLWWFYTWPFRIVIHVTVPNARVHRKLYPLTFLMCIVWIGGTSYVVFWMMAVIGETFEVPDTVMGLTFLAFGGCMPEAVSAVTVIRQGMELVFWVT